MPTPLYYKWINSLKYYKPTTKKLILKKENHETRYCCLGVACEISKLGAWIGNRYVPNKFKDNVQDIIEIDDNDNDIVLPRKVADALGLIRRDGYFNPRQLTKELREEINSTLQEIYREYEHIPTIEINAPSLLLLNDLLKGHTKTFYFIEKILREEPSTLFT